MGGIGIGRVIVPGIEIHYELEDQWQAIEDFRDRMEADYRTWRSDRRQQFTREVLILEEQNDFALESANAWKRIKSRKDPTMAPPFDHVGRILFFKGDNQTGTCARFTSACRWPRLAASGISGTSMGQRSWAGSPRLRGIRWWEPGRGGSPSTIPAGRSASRARITSFIQTPWATDAEALDYVFSHGLTRIAQPDPSTATPVRVPAIDAGQGAGGRGRGRTATAHSCPSYPPGACRARHGAARI